eukprot:snap_masked-scaffold815_size93432-processed-gene-0.6 protein:Tk07750 transcript:snap_masked-scaffold815_size93432-processed-gene-0.6-mRNA-1 annotation:"Vigilin"
MDPATQSAPTMVAEVVEPSPPITNGAPTNGHEDSVVEPTAVVAGEPSPVTQASQLPAKSYDDLFPSLPAAAPEAVAGSNPIGEWNRKPKLASSTVTQVFRIPMEERRDSASSGFGADDSHKQLKTVMDKTGAKIEMSASKDQSLTFVITGKQDVVLKARRELLREFQTQANQTLVVPKEHHRFILGKGGVKLQDLETKTATKITIPKQNDSVNQITVSGTKEGIEKAMHEIRTISDEQSKQAYEVLLIPKMYHPFINGPNGENSKRMIAERPNVRINIPPLSVMKDELSIAGEKEGVLAVKKEIEEMHNDMKRKFSEVSVEVKKTQHKYIIGPKGNSINEILADTGVFVEMPSSESTSETITLRGPQEKLGLALIRYSLPNSQVHVEFVDAADQIKVEGPPDEVEKARESLEGQAKELIDKMSFAEIKVDAKYHKHIIGKGGSTVNKIKQETDVMINIPDSEQGLNKIRVEGNKDGVEKAKKELESLVSKMENEREKDMIIPNRFHRQLIGPKGESIQKLRDDFPNVQISFPDLGSKSEIVKLRGPKDDVDKCAKIMTKTIRDLEESNYQVMVPIFKQFHKFIIGKGGSTIRKIRTETDTRIDLPESGSESDVIAITGKKANVEKAQKELQQIQSEMANVISVDIEVPSKIHNTMIGSGGKLIQSVMDDCGGVSIKFPPSNSNSDKVTIRGPKEDVEKAKTMLLEMANEKQLSSMSAEVRAKPEHHKFLIGRNGANVQSIRDKTGARIIFPNEKDTDREMITILGTKEAVAAAKLELEARIKGLDNVVEETMTVDPKHHKHFISRRGEVLRQIGEEFGGVIVSFPRSGVSSDKVTLKGAKNCVDGAKIRIEEIVEDLNCQVTIECPIEQPHHRTIMGARGSKVQKICADHNVQIKIPERNAGQNGAANANGEEVDVNIIKISGKKENCEAAAEVLRALVPIDEEVEVPFEFHRFIIGAKGAEVRLLMERHDVNIKVPPSEQQSNAIVITGPATNIADAKVALAERVVDLEKEKAERQAKSFEVKVEVNPEYHPKIIGRRGAAITQLRKDFDVNVQLPKKGAPDEHVITITGYESDALKAKDAILKVVGELNSQTKVEVSIDRRIHSMIIGRRGATIRKIMQDFNVDIKLPRDGEEDPDLVVIVGGEDACLDCKDHLLNLAEEYLQEVQDREWMDDYLKPANKEDGSHEKKGNSKGFEVGKGAPWQGASDEAFPTLGGGLGSGPAPSSGSAPSWGPRR